MILILATVRQDAAVKAAFFISYDVEIASKYLLWNLNQTSIKIFIVLHRSDIWFINQDLAANLVANGRMMIIIKSVNPWPRMNQIHSTMRGWIR